MTDADRARRKVFDHASTSDQERYPTSKTASASGSLFNGKEIASFKKNVHPVACLPSQVLGTTTNPKMDHRDRGEDLVYYLMAAKQVGKRKKTSLIILKKENN